MAVYNPMDDMIVGDEADPAYSVKEIPTIPTSPKVDEPRTMEEIQKELQDIALTQEYGKVFEPFYKAVTPEEELKQQIEQKKILNQQLLQEAQPVIQNILQLPQGSREQILALGELEKNLVSKGYQGFNPAEILGSAGQFMYGDERAAIEKAARGELLTAGDFGLIAMAPVSSLDFVFPGIAAKLASKGFTKIDDVLKSSLDIPEVKQVKQTFGGQGATPSGVVYQAEKGEGLASSTPASIDRPKTERSGALVEPSPKAGYKLTDNSKIANAEADLWDEGKKFDSREEFVEAVEKKSGVKGLTVEKIRNAKDYYARKGQLKFGVKRLEYRKGTDEDGLYPFPEPSLTPATKKLIEYIKKNKDKIEPGSLKRLADEYGASYDRIKREFPELSIGQKPSRFTLEASVVARREGTKNKIEQMLRQKKILQAQYPRVDFDKYNVLRRFLQERGLVTLDEKRIREAFDQGIIDEKTLKEIYPGTGKRPGIPEGASLDPIQRILDDTNQSVYDKATEIVERFFGRNIDTGTQKLLVNTIRKNPQREVDKLRQQGALTRDEFDMQDEIKTLSKSERNEARKKYIESLLGEQSEAEYLVEPNIMSKRLQDDIKEGMGFDTGLFKMNAEAAKEANLVMRDYFKDLFINETSDPKLLKFRENFIKQYDKGRKKKTDLTNIDGQNDFLRALKQTYGAQLSHTMPASKRQGAEIADRAENIKINSAAHNVQLQSKVEKRIATQLSNIRKAITQGDMEKVNQYVNTIKLFDDMFKKRNMAGAYYVNSDRVVDVLKDRGLNADRNLLFIGTEKSLRDINDPVREANYMLDYIKKYFDRLIENPEKIEFYQSQLGRPTRQQQRRGLEQEIRKGMPVSEYAKDPFAFKKGGPVKMAMGGDPLTNLNQQQFAPDPAFEGQDYFSEAVESGNLYAFNPTKLFKLFGKVDGVQTPKKITEPEVVDAPAGTTLPATQVVQPQDFPFRSYTLEAIMDPNAPKAATPQAWADFLVKGKQSPVAELKDSGLEQYLRDFEAYFPNQKITQTQLIDYYETSPIGNLSFKVKEDAPVRLNQDPAYSQYSGKQRHKEMGNQPLDEIGSEYREIVVEAGPLPGETKPYVQSGHYEEPNVIGFTRVANYTGKDGRPIAVIQELQTDMLTTVRKEQERLNAMLRRIENFRAKAQQKLQSTSEYDIMEGQRMMENLNQQYPPNVIKALEDNSNLIKPFPNEAAKELIPGFAQDIQNLQKQIDAAVKADIAQTNPETGPLLTQINQQQMEVLSKLQDLNRSGELDTILSGVKVPGTRETEELRNIAESQTFSYLDDGFGYGKKDLTLFPPIPFNKQPDYVDLLLKATIKDAQSKGINKVAIFPADLVNRRWSKTPGSDAAKKFEDLYGKVAIQQMKNIAKKYGGTAQFEAIIDPTKATKGLRYYNRNIDGNKFDILKEEVPRASLSQEEVQPFFDEQIKRIISGDPYQGYSEGDALASSFKVALTREVAPGQTMDYYVLPSDTEKGYILQPFKEGDSLEDAQIVIEEFNPQEVKMFTITLDSPQAEQPMYLFKKKSGGSIDKDSLVSITDIYGEYGR